MTSKNFPEIILLMTISCYFVQQSASLTNNLKRFKPNETLTNRINMFMDSVVPYIITPSAVKKMVSTNKTLQNTLVDAKRDGTIKAFDVKVCRYFYQYTKECDYEHLTMYLVPKRWSYFEGGGTEVPLLPCGIGYGQSGCGSYKYMTSSCGKITAIHTNPESFFTINIECSWFITVDDAYAIELTFEDFSIQECLKSCECDYLKIYDILNGTEIERGTFCGVYSKWTFVSHSNKLKVHYKLGGYDLRTGFSAAYKTIPANTVKILAEVEHVYGVNGSVKLLDFKPTKEFKDQNIYQWIIRTEESRKIELQWSVMNPCDTVVQIVMYDGPGDDNIVVSNFTITETLSGNTESTGFQLRVEITLRKNCTIDFNANFSTQVLEVKYVSDTGFIVNNEFQALNFSHDGNKRLVFRSFFLNKNQFVGYILTVPEQRYVSNNILEFNFKGSHKDNCAQEGMVLWDGLPDQGTKYGPYCGNPVSLWLFSLPFRMRRGIESEQTAIIHSSSNIFTILFYWYSSPNAIPAELFIEANVSDCVGITNNWTNEKNKEIPWYRTNIDITPAVNTCSVYQKLPKNLPSDDNIQLKIKSNGNPNYVLYYFTSVPRLAGCTANGGSILQEYQEINIFWKENCSISPLAFFVKISNKKATREKTIVCLKETVPTETNVDKILSATYVDAYCGHLIFSESPKFFILLEAPPNKKQNYHYIFKFHAAHDVNSNVEILEQNMNKDIIKQKFIVNGNNLPIFWKTSWSYRIGLHIFTGFMSHYETMHMKYQLVPDMYPLPDHGIECLKNHMYGYKGFCYEIVDFKGAKEATWMDGMKQCEKSGGTLLTINTEDELQLIKGLLSNNNGKTLELGGSIFYIGLVTEGKGHRWVDGNPLSLTDWYQKMPTETQLLPEHFFGNKVTFANTKLNQPVKDKSTKCVAMVLTTPSMTSNWIMIPCQYAYYKAGYICKYKATNYNHTTEDKLPQNTSNNTRLVTNDNITFLHPGTTGCPKNWIYFAEKCYRLLSSTKPININYNCTEAQQTCVEYGGHLANVTKAGFENFEYLLKVWKHKAMYQGIWVSDCNIIISKEIPWYNMFDMELALVKSDIELKNHIIDDIHPVLNVMCETRPFEKSPECKHGQFQCDDGTCLLNCHVCDNKKDCIYGEDELNCTCTDSDFLCEDGSCIPMTKYCDFVVDCKDNSDEKNCTNPTCSPGELQCNNGQCLSAVKFNDKVTDCYDGSDEKIQNIICRNDSFTCYDGECIPAKFIKNGRQDCDGSSQEDENLTEKEIKRGRWTQFTEVENEGPIHHRNFSPYCSRPEENGSHSRCKENKPFCFPRHQACVYEMDKYGHITGCSDGSHLLGCEDFQCPTLFKCPESYCIPLHKICDGVVDCIGGADEKECKTLSCPGLFKCRKEGYCIDQSLVCDGIYHCIQSHEDELFCDVWCPSDCTCTGHSINCSYNDYTTIPAFNKKTRSLLLSGNKIDFNELIFLPYKYLGKLKLDKNKISFLPKNIFQHLINLLTLNLRDNRIEHLSVGMFKGLNSLQHLLLSGNPIQTLNSFAFSGLVSIQYLSLDDLRIKHIDVKVFADLPNLKSISLANNSLKQLNTSMFSGASRINHLNLKNNDITNLELETFTALKLEELQTDDYKFCCFATHVPVCTPSGDAFSSCEDLMANSILRILIWVLGISALAGNISIILWRLVTQGKKPNSLLVINLGLSDLLMGVYLITIASADQLYRGRYILFANDWKSSHLCKFAGFLSTVSSQVSVYTLVVITADRLINIVFPFSGKKLSIKHVLILCIIGWISFIILSFLPVINITYFGTHFVKHGVCLLFNVSAGKYPGWEYITFLFLLFNLLSFVFIFTSYVVIYCSINKTRQKSNRTISKAEIEMTKRFVLIVITDFICWVPLIFTALLALGGTPVNPQVSTWMAVFILPINSAINPYLYTLSAMKQIMAQKDK